MKDRLRAVIESVAPHVRPGMAREFLQCMMLKAIHEGHHFNAIAFVGGTALRLCYDLPRFSEDLDFSLVANEQYDFKKTVTEIKRLFSISGFETEVSLDAATVVNNAWFKFPHLLHEMNLSSDPRRKLSIKLEVDTNPPQGAHIEQRLINRHFPVAVTQYGLSSLMAGKLHALLTRTYVKGRDYYDLVWYLTKQQRIVPNIELLAAALTQTKWPGPLPTTDTWKTLIRQRIAHADWSKIVADVAPFLEHEDDLAMMKIEYVLPLLNNQ